MRLSLSVLIVFIAAACNLTTSAPTPIPSPTPRPLAASAPIATITVTERDSQPTSLPLPGLPPTSFPVTSVPSLGTICQVYTTYSGVRADNKLSLRSAPSVDAQQIFRVPNQVEVFQVPGSSEIEADGYHWLNMIYVDSPQMRYQGWIARDSFETNGVRDPAVATLRESNTQRAC